MSESHSSQEPQPQDSNSGESSLLKASGVTGSMTLVSRVLGLARDVVIARVFGVSDGVEAFFVANKIPNFMRRLFAEGAFNQAFVPVLSEYRSTKSLADVQLLVNAVAGSLGGFLLIFTFVAVVAAPLIAVPIAYGFTDEPDKFALLVEMLRITFPYLLLVSMTALCGSILNSYARFAVPAVTPALLNISLIVCSFFLVPYMRVPELALAWAVLIGGVAQLLFQLPFLARMRLMPVPKVGKYHEGVERIKQLMVPALFGVSVSQINLLFDTLLATMLASGSVAWLYYSDRLMELPLGTFGIAIAIVVLPSLSRKHATSSLNDFAETLDWAFRLVVLIAIPSALALIVIAEPLLIALFHNDKFTASDVARSAGSLKAYAIGLIAFMSIKIFAPGYFARQNTSTPVKIGIVAMVSNMVMNLLFFIGGLGHVGLALATSLAAFLNAGLLLRGLMVDGVFKFQPGWGRFLLQVVLANALMVYFLMNFSGDWQAWLSWTMADKIVRLGILVIGAVFIYAAVLFAAGLRWRHIYR